MRLPFFMLKASGNGHSPEVPGDRALRSPAVRAAELTRSEESFDVATLYETHFEFVFRALRQLGVPAASVEDAAQDVFLVVHRRLAGFEARSAIKTWLFGIVLRVASAHRRARTRRTLEVAEEAHDLVGTNRSPQRAAEESEAARTVQAVLDGLDEDRKVIFVMIELEDFSAQEVSKALGIGVTSVHSRLRLARRDFEAAVKRLRARENRRLA